MTKPEFPDLTYLITKSYEGINRQDFAELSALYVPRIREALQNYTPEISKPADKDNYDASLESVMNSLDQLETYFQNFHHNRPRTSKQIATQLHKILLKEVDMLRQLSQR